MLPPLRIEFFRATAHSTSGAGCLEPCIGSLANQGAFKFCQRPKDVKDQLTSA